MLLSEEPAILIHHTIENFNIAPDKLAVSRVTESLSTLQQARDLRVREAESSLKKLSRQLATHTSRHDDLARLRELELQGVEGDAAANARRRDPVDDEVLLRLKVYRSLGIDIERDERDGEWSKAVIRNDRKGDVHVVNMDKKFSRFFYANYFWQTL
ncbi:hypothetical protein RAB80_008203 [Fusarium oxysporum f. sp. vasinfectum]|nr:hypothetical protein RAB80_008203 [Fusarium oxysporum f. sp. vasinfectum]KAK2932680.1 hypothetical protein FoTM2_007139 [Fusarium oxysporum f. sp. vasinfectum]WKT46150.1 hypothetical protein QSH57_011024 [Fusarium oxysporum f. sp. vasinfectum]